MGTFDVPEVLIIVGLASAESRVTASLLRFDSGCETFALYRK